MVPKEIERKFTIKYLPQNVESVKKITQKHIFKDSVCSVRVRRSIDMFTKEAVYTHTIKAREEEIQKYSICELERKITEKEFEQARPFKGSKVVEKYRCIVPIQDGLKAEVDLFEGWMKGLIIAEVEFKSVEQAENFAMPNWFEEPVMHKEFSNRALSTMSRYQITKLIGRKQMADNGRIYEFLRKKILRRKIQ